MSSTGFLAGNYARIKVNNIEVKCKPTFRESGDKGLRGLHIVVLNTTNCQVYKAQVFDTYRSSEQFDKFVDEPLPDGHIVAAACMDECVTKLSDKGVEWFESMGSQCISKLRYRCGFAFIGVVGSNTPLEQMSTKKEVPVSVSQILQLNTHVAAKSVASTINYPFSTEEEKQYDENLQVANLFHTVYTKFMHILMTCNNYQNAQVRMTEGDKEKMVDLLY